MHFEGEMASAFRLPLAFITSLALDGEEEGDKREALWLLSNFRCPLSSSLTPEGPEESVLIIKEASLFQRLKFTQALYLGGEMCPVLRGVLSPGCPFREVPL